MTAWFTEDDLRESAGGPSYSRGRDYVDAVTDLRPTAFGVRAAVRAYEVWLGRDGERLTGECSCPHGADGNFCKHCVAVGLVLLAEDGHGTGVDLGAYLHTLSVDELADLVLSQAQRDPALYRRLALRAAGAPQVVLLRRQVDEALRVRPHQSVGDYAARAREALDTVGDLIDSGHAAEARPLARGAVERLMETVAAIEDPAVVAVCQRALRLYAKACAAARPNPAKLAAWLFQLAKDGPGWPEVSPVDYAEALGDTGLAEYRALLRDAEPTDRVRALRESLATAEGDVDALVDVLREGLPAVRSYRRIVEVLRAAGRLPDAVKWAERAAADHPALADLLVESYLANDQGEEAVEHRKSVLRTTPTRLTYAHLRETATAADMWPEVREWAVAVLTAAATRTIDGTDLTGALLDDRDPESAWEATTTYGCGGSTHLEVLRSRAATHPEDTLPAYRALIESRIEQGGRTCYREAAVLLQELRDASTRAADGDFPAYLALLKQRHTRRKAFHNELTRADL